MSQEELRESLEALRAEIDKLPESDQAVRDRSLQLLENVEQHLESSGQQPEAPAEQEEQESIPSSISQLVEQFEKDHPRLSETLTSILSALGDTGI